MKYYQNIAHFSILQPLTQEIRSCRSRDWQVSVFHVPLRIAALFWSCSKNFDGRRNGVMCITALLLCLTSLVSHNFLCYIALCYLQCRCKGTHRLSEFKNINVLPTQRKKKNSARVASLALWICRVWGSRQMNAEHIMPGSQWQLEWLWSKKREKRPGNPSNCTYSVLYYNDNVQSLVQEMPKLNSNSSQPESQLCS